MYFSDEVKFEISKENERILRTFEMKDEDIIIFYGFPLMFALSSKVHPDIKFLMYIFSAIHEEDDKYYILEKTNEEYYQYMNKEIDLKTFLKTDLKTRICAIESYDSSGKSKVIPLEKERLEKTLSLLKDEIYKR